MPWYGAPEGSASSSGVTSIDVTADSPIVVAGSPITDTGTISLSLPTYSRKAQYSAPVEPWNPAQARGVVFYLNTYNGNMLWQDDTSSVGCFTPCVPNVAGRNRLGLTWCPVNGNSISSESSSQRPYLNRDSTRNTFISFSGANQALRVSNSRSQFAFFYSLGVHTGYNLEQGKWSMGCFFRPTGTGARMGLMDANGRTGSRTGFGLVFEGSSASNTVSLQIAGTGTISNPVSANAAYTDGRWNYVIASGNGTNAYINLNGTVTSATLTAANYSALSSSGIPLPIGTATSHNLHIGSYVTDANYFSGDIANCFIANTNWGEQPVDVAQWLAHDPPFGYYNTNELKYNGRMSSNGIFDMIGISGSATEWLDPREVQGLYDFTDCTDPTNMWTTATGTVASMLVCHGPTRVTSSGDKVAYIENKAVYNNMNPSGLMRMTASNSGDSMLPTYHTNVVNGKGCVYFNGYSPSVIPFTGEQTLNFPAWNQTPKTWFIAFKLTTGQAVDGSHLISTGASNGTYLAVCSSGYSVVGRRNTTVQHSSNGALVSPVSGVNPTGFNISETVQHGGMAAHFINGNWAYSGAANASGSALDFGEFQPTYMGRPAITGWDVNGYIAYKICYNGAIDAETRRRIRGWIADQLGISSYVNTAY
jgi:hypothetical protein